MLSTHDKVERELLEVITLSCETPLMPKTTKEALAHSTALRVMVMIKEAENER